MDASSEAVDLIVKEGVQITEEAAKLVGLGAKNLAAIIIALIKDDNKLQGKTKLKKLLKSEKPLCILQIKEEDLKKFTSEAKKYGVLFTAVGDKTSDSGFIDIIAKQEDVAKLNYIIQEKLGYLEPIAEDIEPEKEEDTEKTDNAEDKKTQSEEQSKNDQTRAEENPPEKESTKHGDTEKTDRGTKPSVKKKIEDIKAEQKAKKQEKEPEKSKSQQRSNNKSKKKKKNKGKKGKSR